MKFPENRKIAWIVFAVCALLCVVLLGGIHMKSDRSKVVDVFYQGTDTALSSRHSMDAYIERAAKSAQTLAEEGTIYLGSEDADSFLVKRLVTDLNDAEALSAEQYSLVNQLYDGVETLYSSILAKDLGDTKMVNSKTAYYDFKGAIDLMENDQYHQLARDFNKGSSGLLAGIIRGIFGIEDLETYGL